MNFNLKNWIQILALVLLCGFVACNEDDSSTSACADTTDCGEHGVDCSEGTCICELGWFGANCEQFDCSIIEGGCVNGDCQPDGTCDCDEGWYGPDCSSDTPDGGTTDCEDIDCGVNSTDCVDGVCICADGWFGADCSSNDPCLKLNVV